MQNYNNLGSMVSSIYFEKERFDNICCSKGFNLVFGEREGVGKRDSVALPKKKDPLK